MEVNVILIRKDGVTTKIEVVKNTATAEATFDLLCEEILGEEDYETLVERVFDYGQRLTDVQNYLNDLKNGYEIEWFNDLTINKFK